VDRDRRSLERLRGGRGSAGARSPFRTPHHRRGSAVLVVRPAAAERAAAAGSGLAAH
jgi:hypothetical protein